MQPNCSTASDARIELTAAGRLFLPEARAVLAAAEAAARVLSEIGGLARGSLGVEASQTIASYWLPRHLVAFRRAWPLIDLRLSIGNTAQVAESVEEGRAELGFVEGAIDNPHLDTRPVARDQLTLIVGAEPSLGRTDDARGGGSARRRMGVARRGLRHALGIRGGVARPWRRSGGAAHRHGIALERGRARGGRGRHGSQRPVGLRGGAEP